MASDRITTIVTGPDLMTEVVGKLIGRHAWFEVCPINNQPAWMLSVRRENIDLIKYVCFGK